MTTTKFRVMLGIVSTVMTTLLIFGTSYNVYIKPLPMSLVSIRHFLPASNNTLAPQKDLGINMSNNSEKMPLEEEIIDVDGENDTKTVTSDILNKGNDISNHIMTETSKTFKIAMYSFSHTGLQHQARKYNKNKCYVFNNCDLIFHRHKTENPIDADAVMLQGNHMPNIRPRHRDTDQVFVFLTVESPRYLHFTDLRQRAFTYYINWTMSYRLDSDIPYPYGVVLPRNVSKEIMLKEVEESGDISNIHKYHRYAETLGVTAKGIPGKDYADIFRLKNSSKSAVWLVSHCKTASKRENYVSRMQKYMKIDVIGRCTNNRLVCDKGKYCDQYIVRTYKFYLAFENSLCTDYITEKAFRWYDSDIVIVVRGARFYDKYLPKGTYINTDDFDGPEELGKYLNDLSSNPEDYLNILKMKDMFRAVQPLDLIQLGYCNLCYRLNNLKHYRKVASHLHEWWDNNVCVNADSDLQKRSSVNR